MRESSLYKNILNWRIYNINYEFSLPFAKKSLENDRQLIPINYNKTEPINIASYMVIAYSFISDEQYLIETLKINK